MMESGKFKSFVTFGTLPLRSRQIDYTWKNIFVNHVFFGILLTFYVFGQIIVDETDKFVKVIGRAEFENAAIA